jgi:hypothetical protein
VKKRFGFVSNSSSSSFCIYGIKLDGSNISEETLDRLRNDDIPEGLDFHSILGEEFYLGRSWAKIRDDQTGLQFKQEVEKLITELAGKPIVCSTEEEAWDNH